MEGVDEAEVAAHLEELVSPGICEPKQHCKVSSMNLSPVRTVTHAKHRQEPRLKPVDPPKGAQEEDSVSQSTC